MACGSGTFGARAHVHRGSRGSGTFRVRARVHVPVGWVGFGCMQTKPRTYHPPEIPPATTPNPARLPAADMQRARADAATTLSHINFDRDVIVIWLPGTNRSGIPQTFAGPAQADVRLLKTRETGKPRARARLTSCRQSAPCTRGRAASGHQRTRARARQEFFTDMFCSVSYYVRSQIHGWPRPKVLAGVEEEGGRESEESRKRRGWIDKQADSAGVTACHALTMAER